MIDHHDVDVVLLLELNVGDAYGVDLPQGLDPEYWEDTLYQKVWSVADLKLVGVKFERNKP